MSLCLSSGEYPEAVTRGVFCKKRCFEKLREIHKKTPVPESLL